MGGRYGNPQTPEGGLIQKDRCTRRRDEEAAEDKIRKRGVPQRDKGGKVEDENAGFTIKGSKAHGGGMGKQPRNAVNHKGVKGTKVLIKDARGDAPRYDIAPLWGF